MRFGGTVELHLHMDICMSFEAVALLDPTVGADTYRREFVGPSRFDSLTAFLASTERHVELLQTERGLRTCMRDLRSQLAADDALHADDLPVAFDLAGDEAGYPLTTHLPAFEIVRGADGPFTVHAGEAAGPESVREVLDHLEPRRISHGIRAVEDPDLVARLVREGVHLEACASSNVQISVVPSMAEHPIGVLVDAGVSIGISTDQRGITDTTLRSQHLPHQPRRARKP